MRLIYIANRDAQMAAFSPVSGATIVRESRGQISSLFGFLAVCCAAALARGEPAARTTAGRVAVVVIFGGLLAALAVGWIVWLRRLGRLEITEDAIRYVPRGGQVTTLSRASRQQGSELRWVKQLRGRTWRLGLTVAGTADVMIVGTFSRKAVQQACLARGWQWANLNPRG